MATVPASTSLATIVDGSAIIASDHRNNYSAIQTALNALIAILAAGTSGQVLRSGGGTTVAWAADDAALPWLIDVDVFPTAISQTNWDTITVDALNIYNGYKQSTTVQNAEINWDLVLAAGTWTIEVVYESGPNAGILTVEIDGVSVGTVDSYSASQTRNVRSSVTGVAVSSSAKHRLKLLMATKNASASAYGGFVSHVQLRRTA